MGQAWGGGVGLSQPVHVELRQDMPNILSGQEMRTGGRFLHVSQTDCWNGRGDVLAMNFS